MKQPSGSEILSYLVELLAEQNGLSITYEIVKKDVS